MAANKHIINHHQLNDFLASVKEKDIPGLFLIFGESFLAKQAFKTLSLFLLGRDHAPFAIETLEGDSVSLGDIIEQVATFSFLVPKKIVKVKNIALFQPSAGSGDHTFSSADLDHFAQFIDTGIPDNHFLVMTAASVDKRKKIFKEIEARGIIIDCSVAQGVRKADLDEQRALLQTLAGQILAASQKTIDAQAFQALVELTGFNLDLFSQNLEKLMAYSGKNRSISLADVTSVIIRDKKDPIFNLTNAVMEKDVKKSLFFLNSLFNEGFHPLQILKSFENLIRKLILVKCFTTEFFRANKTSLKQINFNAFTQSVLPKIIHHDGVTKMALDEQDNDLNRETTKKKKSPAPDLFLAPNPKNPYPVFQVFQKSENFSLADLNQAFIFLGDLDYKLKSSSFDARTKIESFIINICR